MVSKRGFNMKIPTWPLSMWQPYRRWHFLLCEWGRKCSCPRSAVCYCDRPPLGRPRRPRRSAVRRDHWPALSGCTCLSVWLEHRAFTRGGGIAKCLVGGGVGWLVGWRRHRDTFTDEEMWVAHSRTRTKTNGNRSTEKRKPKKEKKERNLKIMDIEILIV